MPDDAAVNFDVLEHISRCCDTSTLLALCASSRGAREAAIPSLYREICIQLENHAQTEAVLLTLICQPQLAACVRVFKTRGFVTSDETSIPLGLVRLALQQMPHLEVLDAANCLESLIAYDGDASLRRALCSVPSLDIVHIPLSNTLDALLAELPPMRRIAFCNGTGNTSENPWVETPWETMNVLLQKSAPTLTALDVQASVEMTPIVGQSDQWLAVAHLGVYTFSPTLSLLFPNVTHLHLHGPADLNLLGDPHVFPSLTAVFLSDEAARDLHDGLTPRTLNHVSLNLAWMDDLPRVDYFAAGAHLTSLCICRRWPRSNSYWSFERLFRTMTELFPNLHYLGITLVAGYHRETMYKQVSTPVRLRGLADWRSQALLNALAASGPINRDLRVLSVKSSARVDFTPREQLRLRRGVENTFPGLEFAEINFSGDITHWAWYRVLYHGHSFRRRSWPAPDAASDEFDTGTPVRPHCDECISFQKNAPFSR